MNKFLLLLSIIGWIGVPNSYAADDLVQLLENVKHMRYMSSKENAQREAVFLKQQNQREAMLKKANDALVAEKKRSGALKQALKSNEKILTELSQEITKKSATLGELFGVVRQVSGETLATLNHSIVSAEILERGKLLSALASSESLPSIKDLNQLWYEMQREMTASGQVSQFSTTVINAQGLEEKKWVTRVGTFNIVTEGVYLRYLPKTNQLMALPRQPPQRYMDIARHFESERNQNVAFVLDPSRGTLLNLLTQAPNVEERVAQGGMIGYIILGIGVVGLLIAFERYFYLLVVGFNIKRQMKRESISLKNPLGRIMSVYQDSNADLETLNLQIDEAILRETPKLEKRVDLLGVLGAIAPLLGLLGTVIGMIETFQSIALFGTGDPKLMSGGISQALVTTGLGLIVAIPVMLLHGFIQGKSSRLVQILDEESAGLVVQFAEKHSMKAVG